jgi:helix-hairpin-helix protein
MLLSVRHIGPRRARRLVDGLGDRWAELIDADPERVFGTLRGMGRRRATIAAASWRELAGSEAADRDRGIASPLAPHA